MHLLNLMAAGVFLSAACLTSVPRPALAQADYPNRTIKIVVPTPAGTTADLLPRIIGEKLEHFHV